MVRDKSKAKTKAGGIGAAHYHSEQLSRVLEREPQLSLFDLRQPLEVLADSEMIPGSRRICPHKVMENPWIIPGTKRRWFTAPVRTMNDELSRVVLQRVLSMGSSESGFSKAG
jgi:hypothetical protein